MATYVADMDLVAVASAKNKADVRNTVGKPSQK